MKNDDSSTGKRPTAKDLARVAGVSTATVDRVLNGRLPVRESTARRVEHAARELGYHFSAVIERRVADSAHHHRLSFILQRRESRFYQGLARRIEDTAARLGRHIVVDFAHVAPREPARIAECLRKAARQADAIALVAPDHPLVDQAVRDVTAEGVPVLTLFSDCALAARHAYIGVDNRKAGRSAAWLIQKIAPAPGPVAVFVGSQRFRGHELREMGFRTCMREEAPAFQVVDTLFNLEEPEIAREATCEVLRRHPDLVGLYVAGGGAEGVIEALREKRPDGGLAVVCSEHTELSQAALAERLISAIVAAPIDLLAHVLIERMMDLTSDTRDAPGSEIYLPIQVFLPESI